MLWNIKLVVNALHLLPICFFVRKGGCRGVGMLVKFPADCSVDCKRQMLISYALYILWIKHI